MNTHRYLQCVGVVNSLTLIACSAIAQNLIVNGSFEAGPGAYARFYAPSTAIPGWQVTRTSIDYTTGWQASDGAFLIDLDGNDGDAGGMAQTFSTVPGASYTVKFDLAGNPGTRVYNNYPRVKYMRVTAAGQSADYSFDTTGRTFNSMGWTQKTWQFTANSTSTTLEFYSLDAPAGAGCGPAIDKVIVTGAVFDLVTKSLSWNNVSGGADFQYEVRSNALATATTAKLFWASGTTAAAIIPGVPVIFTQNIPIGASGLSAVIPVPAANFADTPATATHVLLVLDPDNLIPESDEGNNVMALELPLLGIDVSRSAGLVAASTWQAIQDAGKKFVVVAGWGGVTKNEYAAFQLAGARNAGLLTAGYCFLNFRDSVDGRCQVKKALKAFGAEAAYLKFLAIDVEPAFLPPNYQSAAAQQATVNRIREAVMEVAAAGLTPIIYSKQNDWDPMTGACTEFGNLALWLVQYNSVPNLPAVSFGGWTTSSAKQYVENDTLAGIQVDLNISAPSLFSGPYPVYVFPPPNIQYNVAQGVLTLAWCDEDAAFVLEQSSSLVGPWSPVATPTNPFVVDISGQTAVSGGFFRLRMQ